MSESKKFTPGPWEHKKDGDGEWRVRQKGSVKKVLGGTTERPVCEVVNTIADARLIAAAPDLLEALEALVKINEDHNNSIQGVIGTPPGWSDSYLDAARKAIAKSRGQQ